MKNNLRKKNINKTKKDVIFNVLLKSEKDSNINFALFIS